MANGQQAFTGGRAKLKVNGLVIGWAQRVRPHEEIAQEPVDVLDRMEPAEYAVTGYRVSFTFGFVKIDGNSLRDLGVWPLQGGTSAQLRANLLNMLEFVTEVEDSVTGNLIWKATRCKVVSQDIDVTPRGLISHDVNCNAIYASEQVDGV